MKVGNAGTGAVRCVDDAMTSHIPVQRDRHQRVVPAGSTGIKNTRTTVDILVPETRSLPSSVMCEFRCSATFQAVSQGEESRAFSSRNYSNFSAIQRKKRKMRNFGGSPDHVHAYAASY